MSIYLLSYFKNGNYVAGDPTTFGNLKAADETMKATVRSLESGKYNGYAHTQGHEIAREAVAKYSAHQSPGRVIDPNDVILCSGCSSALEYCILALADRGQNVLLPRPGFCLYRTLVEGLDIEVRYYDLLPEKQWRADLVQLESLIDDKTAALLINNPSNPCGSVYDREHLQDLVDICERHYLPIIADEVSCARMGPNENCHKLFIFLPCRSTSTLYFPARSMWLSAV